MYVNRKIPSLGRGKHQLMSSGRYLERGKRKGEKHERKGKKGERSRIF
jgi:hypothetical protein